MYPYVYFLFFIKLYIVHLFVSLYGKMLTLKFI